MNKFDQDTFRTYMMEHFNATPDNDYAKPTTKVFIIAYDYMSTLEKQKVIDNLNDGIASLIGSAFQGAMRNIAKDIDMSQGD